MDFRGLDNVDFSLISMILANSELTLLKGESFGRRTVHYFELDYIISADDGVMITNYQKQNLSRGMLFIRKPGTVVEGIASYKSYYATLSVTNHDNIDLPDCIIFQNTLYIESLFKSLYDNYLNRNEAYFFVNRAILFNIFLEIYRVIISDNLYRNNEKLKETILYIENNFSKNITLDDIVAFSGYSKSRLCHLMTGIYNVPPMAYLIKCRMSYACRVLIETNKSIKEISFECGYNNIVCFYRAFQKYTHKTPKDYRESHRLIKAD